MSFSFSVRAADKAGAKARVAEEMAKVVAQQSTHSVDETQVRAVADAYVELLGDREGADVAVYVCGYISSGQDGVYAAKIEVVASLEKREG